MNEKQIKLRRTWHPISHEDQVDIAQRFSTLVSLDQKTKPYHPDSDQSRWSIDQYGNDFWLRFTGDNELVISCRYEQQIPILKAMAEYAAVRLHLKIIPS